MMKDRSLSSMGVRRDQIFDLGSHVGDFTEYYLRKGFQVVCVDANRYLEGAIRQRFFQELECGQCKFLLKGICSQTERVRFYVNTDCDLWSSLDLNTASRNDSQYTMQWIEGITIPQMIEDFGLPYMLKIDLEDSTYPAVRQLGGVDARPPFLSVHDQGGEIFEILYNLGYTHFNLRPQKIDAIKAEPLATKEGRHSGLAADVSSPYVFGLDLDDWIHISDVEEEYERARKLTEFGWLDIHASFSPGNPIKLK